MKKQILKLFTICICLYLVEALIPGVYIGSIFAALGFSFVLTLLSLLLRPLLLLITLPINLVTLGLFSVVINALLIALSDILVRGVNIISFWIDLLLALLIAMCFKAAKQAFPIYAKN